MDKTSAKTGKAIKKVQGLKKHKLRKPKTKGQKSVYISGISKNRNKEKLQKPGNPKKKDIF